MCFKSEIICLMCLVSLLKLMLIGDWVSFYDSLLSGRDCLIHLYSIKSLMAKLGSLCSFASFKAAYKLPEIIKSVRVALMFNHFQFSYLFIFLFFSSIIFLYNSLIFYFNYMLSLINFPISFSASWDAMNRLIRILS